MLRALLVQVLDSIRSEHMLMEQRDYNLLFRRFVGFNADEVVWHPTVYSHNEESTNRHPATAASAAAGNCI